MNVNHPPQPHFRLAHYYREALGTQAQRQWPEKDWRTVEPLVKALWVDNALGGAWGDVRAEIRKAWIKERLRSRRALPAVRVNANQSPIMKMSGLASANRRA